MSNAEENRIIKTIGLHQYSQNLVNQYLSSEYTVLDTKIDKNHKRSVLLKCPIEYHNTYWTNLSVIKKGCGCRKCIEDPEVLTDKKIKKIQDICYKQNCTFIDIVPTRAIGFKKLVIKIQDKDGFLYNITIDHLQYRKLSFTYKFTNNPYIIHNLKQWTILNRPEYIFHEDIPVENDNVYTWEYIGPDKEKITDPFLKTKWTYFVYNQVIHPELKKYRKSQGHNLVKQFLIEQNITFQEEKTFSNLLSHRHAHLFFDFYLTDFNIAIEVDGTQHNHPITVFGGEQGFATLIENDNIKNNFCTNNNITLLRIPYNHIIYNKKVCATEEYKAEILSTIKNTIGGEKNENECKFI